MVAIRRADLDRIRWEELERLAGEWGVDLDELSNTYDAMRPLGPRDDALELIADALALGFRSGLAFKEAWYVLVCQMPEG